MPRVLKMDCLKCFKPCAWVGLRGIARSVVPRSISRLQQSVKYSLGRGVKRAGAPQDTAVTKCA